MSLQALANEWLDSKIENFDVTFASNSNTVGITIVAIACGIIGYHLARTKIAKKVGFKPFNCPNCLCFWSAWIFGIAYAGMPSNLFLIFVIALASYFISLPYHQIKD